jgi:ribosomal protein L37AE/L43A
MSDTPHAQPFYCPFCGEQDLRPSASTGWHCAVCDRRFELAFLGLGLGQGLGEEQT